MTGFGEAQTVHKGLTIRSELKTINNRYLKTTLRIPESYSFLESQVESWLKNRIVRGTVILSLKIREESPRSTAQIDIPLLKSYLLQTDRCLFELSQEGMMNNSSIGSIADYLALPGIIREETSENDDEETYKNDLWQKIEENLELSLISLRKTRIEEGAQMEKALRSNLSLLTDEITEIEKLAPGVAENYRARLSERIENIMSENNLPTSPADLVREVALFTDRADISEEIVRFRSHLHQFDLALQEEESCGKKLDFLTQEMFREVNTTGAKANSHEITNHVVLMKTIIEKIREMVQNIE